MTAAPVKARSNRPLTQFACEELQDFVLNNVTDGYRLEQKNTAVVATVDGRKRTFVVTLFEEEILRVVLDGLKPISIRIAFTSFFDGYGQPTSTTAERLNGLLDLLGWIGLIPQGVRLFRDQEYRTTYLGKGDDKIAVGQDLYHYVYIKPDRSSLQFAGYGSVFIAEELE